MSHDISFVNQNTIDGKYAYGIDGDLPHEEILSMDVTIIGRSYSIQRDLFADCYDPTRQKSIRVFLTETDTAFIFMNGSDGAGSYSVVWYVSPNSQDRIITRHVLGFIFLD